MAITVLLADDHEIVRQGVRLLLEREGLNVVAEAANGPDAVALAPRHVPDVAVLDFVMPRLNGVDAAREILHDRPSTAVILLSMETQEHQVAAALRAGARAYIPKTQAADDLLHAIREVAAGHIFLSSSLSHVIVDGYLSGHSPALDPLCPRERQVLQLIAGGQTCKQIASELGKSVRTIENQLRSARETLNAANQAELISKCEIWLR